MRFIQKASQLVNREFLKVMSKNLKQIPEGYLFDTIYLGEIQDTQKYQESILGNKEIHQRDRKLTDRISRLEIRDRQSKLPIYTRDFYMIECKQALLLFTRTIIQLPTQYLMNNKIILITQQMQLNQGSLQIDEDCSVYTDEININNQPLSQIPPQQMSKRIHKNIVALQWKMGKSVGSGSGLLISKNLVLTSAHNFFVRKKRVIQGLFQIYPGQCGIINKVYKIEKLFIPPEYQICPDTKAINYDYALIKLSQEVEKAADFIELDAKFIFSMNKSEISLAICGYPATSYRRIGMESTIYSVNQSGLMKKNAVLAIKQKKDEIIHLISTEEGQSGSPIILVQGQALSVIGIHKGGVTTKIDGEQIKANSGRLITKQLIEILKSEAVKMKADMFKTTNTTNQISQSLEKEINLYREAIKTNPIDSEAYNSLGNALSDIYEMGEAISSYRKAIQFNQLDSDAYNNLGIALKTINQVDKAIQYYRKAIAINPRDSHVYSNLGVALRTVHRIGEAIECYRKAIEINPQDPSAYNNLAALYEQSNEMQSALSYYHQALQRDPNDPRRKNNFNQILNYFRKANKIPKGFESHFKSLS